MTDLFVANPEAYVLPWPPSFPLDLLDSLHLVCNHCDWVLTIKNVDTKTMIIRNGRGDFKILPVGIVVYDLNILDILLSHFKGIFRLNWITVVHLT